MKTTNVSELVSRLKSADDAYYNSSEPLISDEEYDFLKDSLSQIDPENDYLKKIGAPVSRDTPWEKAKHKISMCSLNKCNTEDEFIKWCNETGVDGVINTFVLQEKLDGLSINLEYENGTLKRAISRGDGCCCYDDLVELEDGTKEKIGKIVNERKKVKIKTLNLEKNLVEFKRIKNHFSNNRKKAWFEIVFEHNGLEQKVILTENHYVWLPKLQCYRKVKDLTVDDFVLLD